MSGHHPYLVVSILTLACLVLLLPGRVTSLEQPSGANQHPGQYQSHGRQRPHSKMTYEEMVLRKFANIVTSGAVIGINIAPFTLPFLAAAYLGLPHLLNARDKPGLGASTGAPYQPPLAPLAPLAPFMPTVAPWSTAKILLTVMISITLLLLLLSCGVGGFFFYRSADKQKNPQGAGGGGQTEASTSKTTSTTNTSTAK